MFLDMTDKTNKILPKPPWIKVQISQNHEYKRLAGILRKNGLNTVCDEALCPNKCECWKHGRATIMILGRTCTRNCHFCNVEPTKGKTVDKDEPFRTASAIKEIGLHDVVITSVTRDDLPDGGAGLWAETIRRVKEAIPDILLEVLVPDFNGLASSLETVIEARPDVFGHNLETVPSLYGKIREKADYKRSLDVLRQAGKAGLIVKTAVMVGLGETEEEIFNTMDDALNAGCDIFFIGQYLMPSKKHWPVKRYVHPDEFEEYRNIGLKKGFKVVVSAPLVRSSFYSPEQEKYVRNKLGKM